MSKRLRSVAAAQIALHQPAPHLSVSEPLAITTDIKSRPKFDKFIVKTLTASIFTGMVMFVATAVLVGVLNILSMSLAWLLLAVPVILLFVFSGILHTLD